MIYCRSVNRTRGDFERLDGRAVAGDIERNDEVLEGSTEPSSFDVLLNGDSKLFSLLNSVQEVVRVQSALFVLVRGVIDGLLWGVRGGGLSSFMELQERELMFWRGQNEPFFLTA